MSKRKNSPEAGKGGRVCIALSFAALAAIIGMAVVMGLLITANSLKALWPPTLEMVTLADGSSFLGVAADGDVSPDGAPRRQYRVANRDFNAGADFRWVNASDIVERSTPGDAVLLKRRENGDFFGFLKAAGLDKGKSEAMGPEEFTVFLADFQARRHRELGPLEAGLARLGDRWQDARLAALKAGYEERRAVDAAARSDWEKRRKAASADEEGAKHDSEGLLASLGEAQKKFADATARFAVPGRDDVELPLDQVMGAEWPNALGVFGKIRVFFVNIWNLLSQYPREANTEGGLFPAIFGTVALVFIMSISAFPLGVAAGVYLREYAKDGYLSRAARVAVNNLAGVPSIVYGMFGLGFFVYGLGGTIDAWFFPERVEAGLAVFGGGGILWSSLTLGLLTLPVVVVATEEALTTVPSEVRQGSLALGATRFQTLWRVTLPMASPGILTGFILAMARAAGEVAPLMLTGVVKSAPGLAVDGSWPFLHLERKFMHLGFHIYDMGFQSPNVEAAKPMVYLTAMVLLVLVFVLNLAAFRLRRRMRDKYAIRGF